MTRPPTPLACGLIGMALLGVFFVPRASAQEGRLRPQLLLVLDRDKKPYASPRPLDLLAVTHDQDGKPLEIATSLEPGSFGVDPVTLVV